MVTDIFFDLQRFADDTLTNDGAEFTWAGGGSFEGEGTEDDPASYATAGTSGAVAAIEGTEIYLKGTEEGYSFVINENKDNWEIANIQGEDNVVSGDYTDETGAYGLEGNIDVKVYAGKEFDETVNDEDVYVKAADADVEVNVAADGTAMTYTFADGVEGVAVGLDSNDTAVFEGAGTNVSLGAAASASAIEDESLDFTEGVTVTSDGTEVFVESGDNVFTEDDGSTWEIETDGTTNVTVSADEITGVTGRVTFTPADGTVDAEVTVNGKAWKGNGAVTDVSFDSEGNAHINNTNAAVTVEGEEGAYVGFASLTTAGVVVNDATIKAASASGTFAVELDDEGIKGIAFDEEDPAVNIAGDSSFEVLDGAGNKYTIETSADDITFDGNATPMIFVQSGEAYTVEGADGYYTFEDSTGTDVSINDAEVEVADGEVIITSEDDNEGIEKIYLNPDNSVSVSNDDDGYTAIFITEDTEEDVTLQANGLQIVADADVVDEANVSVTFADADDTEATVKGIEGDTIITLMGGEDGATYHIKDATDGNKVVVAAGDNVVVYLDEKGNVGDVADEDALKALDKYFDKWNDIAYMGSETDTVVSHRGEVYEQFYDLSGISSTSLGYSNDDDTTPSTTESAIQIIGQSPLGEAMALGEALHVTLDVNSGTNTGEVPINIQKNETDAVVDVTIDLTDSDQPSTVIVGGDYSTDEVTASHTILLSDKATGYAIVDAAATGQNKIVAGDGAADMRHYGETKASIIGGTGNDTIYADKNDYVEGNGGADLFLDDNSYTVQDYDAEEGDAVIATRFSSLDKITPDQISGKGNKVQFGKGGTLTLDGEDRDSAESLHVKVAVMDGDGNVSSARRDIYLANEDDELDATNATDGALIIANSDRGGNAQLIGGSDYKDTIYAGAGDSVYGGAGNDSIILDYVYEDGAVVGLLADGDHDTVSGWIFGFDRDEGATELYTGGKPVTATINNGELVLGANGASLTVEDFYYWDQILVEDEKYYFIDTERTAYVWDNDDIGDYYIAKAKGGIYFDEDVTDDLGEIDLTEDKYQNITYLGMYNNSKASIIGSDDRETVVCGGDADEGASKEVYLSGGNDIIYSSGDDGPSNVFYFGIGDGRDSLYGFGHYLGVDEDPQKQQADLLVIEDFDDVYVSLYTDEDLSYEAARIVLSTSENDAVVIYENASTWDYDSQMYRVNLGGDDEYIAKIGYSETVSGAPANNFTYDDEVDFYVGSAGKARDILTIDDTSGNDIQVWLDNRAPEEDDDFDFKYYRGIGVIDASDATGTRLSLAGSAEDNTIFGGGVGSETSLWGGEGDNLLVGGEGEDVFFYFQGSRDYVNEGSDVAEANHDTIIGYDRDNDDIFLGDITLDDIDFDAMVESGNDGISDTGVKVRLNNGGTLDVVATGDITFVLGDGEVYTANTTTKEWKQGDGEE